MRVDLTGQRFGRLEVVEYDHTDRHGYWLCACDCGEFKVAQGYRLRVGQTLSCGCLSEETRAAGPPSQAKPDEEIGYQGAHSRVRAAKGKASQYKCADCNGWAAHWSLKHGAATGQESGRTFSPNPKDYEPRCASCHQRYDRAEH